MAEMKGIKLCGECGNYDWKKHKCKIGCNDDSNAQASFYGDCPLPDVVPKSEVEKDFDDLKRYIILNEDIAIKCKRENGEQNEEYWKGKISAFRQIRAYIDAELKKKYTESEDKE